MKRSTELRRTSRLETRTPLRRETPMVKVNPEKIGKRRKRTAEKRRSPESKAAAREAWERSGGRCEFTVETAKELGHQVGGLEYRCPETEHLEEHHDAYDPPRVRIFCRGHHHFWEWVKRPHNRGRLGR